MHWMEAMASLRTGAPFSPTVHSTPANRSSPGANRCRKCFISTEYSPSPRQFNTNGSPTCISDSMARSLATAMVMPSGSNDAWLTQDATMAPLAPPCASAWPAVTIYRPPDTRARALATSDDIALFFLAITSFCVSACARSVPASSNCW